MSNSPTRINVDDGFSITVRQIETLLRVIGDLKHLRSRPLPDNDDGDSWKKLLPKELDGGSKVALEVAICSASDRLTALLKENTRWGRQQSLFKRKLEELFDAQIETQEEASVNEALKRRPTLLYRPHFTQLKDGRWTAFLVDNRGVPSVIGVGATPEAAAQDFDQVFQNGRLPDAPKQPPKNAEEPRKDTATPQPTEERPDPPSS